MFRSLKSMLLIGLCLLAVPAFGAEAIRWQTNVIPAFRRAEAERKPLVIFFYGEGPDGMLPWSRKLAEGSFASTEVAVCQESAVFLKVNVNLEDASGNVKRLKDDLNVNELPTVAVVDVGPSLSWRSQGPMKGFFEHAEFTANLRTDLVSAMIKIRGSSRPAATGDELVHRVEQARAEAVRINENLASKVDGFRRQLRELLQLGQFDGPAFERAAAERSAAHLALMPALLDLAELSPEAEAFNRVILTLGIYELGLCRRLERDLMALTVGGRLPDSAAVELAQALVRTMDEAAAAMHQNSQEAIKKTGEKFNNWMNELAAK